jgi:hypothetical protein
MATIMLHCTPAGMLSIATLTQELKSKQPDLPQAVAHDLEAAGWVSQGEGGCLQLHSDVSAAADGTTLHERCESQEADLTFAVPGLTITSFHLDQLRASRRVLPGVRHAWLVQEVTEPGLLQVGGKGGKAGGR